MVVVGGGHLAKELLPWLEGRDRLGIQPVPEHDIAIHLDHAERRGEDLPVLIAVGDDPILTLVGGMPILYDQSEYKMAAAIQGRPYPVVRMATEVIGRRPA